MNLPSSKIQHSAKPQPRSRVKFISVKGLFEVFDHRIPLNQDERITIIHGPNGIGKTVLLRMVDGLFRGRYGIFSQVPFDEFRVELDNNIAVIVKPPNKKNKQPTLEFEPNYLNVPPIPLLSVADEEIADYIRYLSKYRFSGDPDAQSFDTLEEALAWISVEDLPRELRSRTKHLFRSRQELSQLGIQTRFIRAQRLQLARRRRTRSEYERRQSYWPRDEPDRMETELAVEQFSHDLAKEIAQVLAEYANRSQALDRTFPDRLVQRIREANSNKSLSNEEIANSLRSLDEQRQALVSAGLLGEQESITSLETWSDPSINVVLSEYICDVEEKFQVFNILRTKIELLANIINARFLNKVLCVQQEVGFEFSPTRGKDKRPLSPRDLSSGEQHQLVLFYELLFNVEHNSLVLIDEPELSLHIAWQNQFLIDLEEIVKTGRFDVIIATHSPDIIYDRWDLTIDLSGEAVST